MEQAHIILPFSFPLLINFLILIPGSLEDKIVTRSLGGGGGQSHPPPHSTFDTIHPIDLKFGANPRLYFQLSVTMWCLTGFHGNNMQINDVTGGRPSWIFKFSDFVQSFTFAPQIDGKQHLAVEIHKIGRIHCQVVSI